MAEIKDFVGTRVERSFELTNAVTAVDQEERTIQLAFASDQAIEHWFGSLTLAIDRDHVRCDRLDRGCPLLLDHNRESQVGVVEDYSFDSDGIARAVVRFSKAERAEEIFQDVLDGIRQNVSVGFIVHDLTLVESEEDRDMYRSEDWEVLELSIVSVPADVSVGVGRSETDNVPIENARSTANGETNTMAETNENVVETPQDSEIVRATQKVTEFTDYAALFGKGYVELAQEMALEDKSLDQLRTAIQVKRAKEVPTPKPEAEAPKEQAEREGGVQLAKSVYRGGTLKAFRGKGGHEQAYRFGQWLNAVIVRDTRSIQFCKERGLLERAHTGTDNPKGGFLVPDEFENVMIDLRLQYGVFRANSNVVPMMSETKSRPRRTGGLTAYAIGAGVAITESEKSWDLVNLVAKKWGVLSKWENEVGEDAVVSLADDLASEIAYAFANKEDECGFNGDGTSTYHGIVGVRQSLLDLSATRANIAGLQVASGNLYSEIVLADFNGVVARLPQFARRSGSLKWYCSHAFYSNVMQKVAQAVGGVTYGEVSGQIRETFFGVPVEITEVMPSTEANDQVCCLYGNLAQASMFGDRRGTQIAMTDSDSTDFAQDQMAIRGTERFDINVHDVGNASGTAADRLGGGVVGLLTAAS